nr:hypothetical protein C1892_07080 [Pseudomonas sp. MPBD7-1]
MGASLLAIAVDQPTLMLTGLSLSRASSLPQLVLCCSQMRGQPQAFMSTGPTNSFPRPMTHATLWLRWRSQLSTG